MNYLLNITTTIYPPIAVDLVPEPLRDGIPFVGLVDEEVGAPLVGGQEVAERGANGEQRIPFVELQHVAAVGGGRAGEGLAEGGLLDPTAIDDTGAAPLSGVGGGGRGPDHDGGEKGDPATTKSRTRLNCQSEVEKQLTLPAAVVRRHELRLG